MATVRLNWVLPTKRTSGLPLSPDEIKFTRVEMSADQGATWANIGQYPPATLTTDITELEPGTWFFRGIVVDIRDKESSPLGVSIVVPDTTPPGALAVLTATLV